jgi:hypothetical protein
MLHTDIWSVVVGHLDYATLLQMESVSRAIRVLCEGGWEARLFEKTGRRVSHPKEIYRKMLRAGYPHVIHPSHTVSLEMADVIRVHASGDEPRTVVVNVFNECWLADGIDSIYIGLAEDAMVLHCRNQTRVFLLFKGKATLRDGENEIVVDEGVTELLLLHPSKLVYIKDGNVVTRTYTQSRLEDENSVIARKFNYISWSGWLYVDDEYKWFHTDSGLFRVTEGDACHAFGSSVWLLKSGDLYLACTACLNKKRDRLCRMCNREYDSPQLFARDVVWMRAAHESRYAACILRH